MQPVDQDEQKIGSQTHRKYINGSIDNLPPALPNYLTVVGFGLIMIIYASRDRVEEQINTAEDILYEHIEEIKKSIEFEQKLMRWMDTALYKNEASTPQEAEIQLLIYISDFVNAEKE